MDLDVAGVLAFERLVFTERLLRLRPAPSI
jgi:hypothetical protein